MSSSDASKPAFITTLNEKAPFLTNKEQPVGYLVGNLLDLIVDSRRFLQRCTKPDAKEFKKIAVSCAMGFMIMGMTGYVVKLVFIPINNIIVGMGM